MYSPNADSQLGTEDIGPRINSSEGKRSQSWRDKRGIVWYALESAAGFLSNFLICPELEQNWVCRMVVSGPQLWGYDESKSWYLMLGKSSPALEQICLRTWWKMRAGAGQFQGAGKQGKPRALRNSECREPSSWIVVEGAPQGQWLTGAHTYDLSRACEGESDGDDVNDGSDSNNNDFDDEN